MYKIKLFFLKYWLFIFLGALIAFLGGFYFKNKVYPIKKTENLLPLSSPKIDHYNLSDSSKLSLGSLGNFSLFEKNLDVYQVIPASLSDQEATSLAQQLGFFSQPIVSYDQQESPIYSWDTKEKSLLINLRWGNINYNLNPDNFETIDFKKLPPPPEAEKIAKNFLEEKKISLPANIALTINNISYVVNLGTELKEVPSLNEARLIMIEFGYEINNKKVDNLFIKAAIDGKNQVVILNYESGFKEIKKIDSYPLKTINEIIKNIEEKKSISYLKITDYYGALNEELENIININFNNISLVYYKSDPLQTYLQPILLITGEANLTDGTQAEVGLYLPAIKDEYLLK